MTPYDRLAQENASLRQRVCELEADVRQLEREIGQQRDKTAESLLSKRLKVSPSKAVLLHSLYKAHPRSLSTVALFDRMPHPYKGEDAQMHSVSVQVAQIRRSQGQGLIDGRSWHGYSLTETGMALVQQALHVAQPAVVA